tara:strand:- start:1528 stop:1686 length:159 start_codon:yes stop_codon:yes gene_type:complete
MTLTSEHNIEKLLGRLERVSSICNEIAPGTWAFNYWKRVNAKLQEEKTRLLQ